MTIHKELSIPYLKTIGIVNNGFNGRGFQNPHSLTIGPDQKIFVLNRCDVARRKAIRIGVMNYDEDYLYEFGYGFGSGEGQLALAVDMAFDSTQRIHVTDEFNNRVNVYSETGEYLTKWGESGSGEGQFDGPSGITINSKDEIIVVDQRNNRVQKYSKDGQFIFQWGQLGSGEGQFNLPWGVCVDGVDNIYVADWRNDRVQKFDNSGNYLMTIGLSVPHDLKLLRPSSVAVDSLGNIYVADWGNERVQVYDDNGVFVNTLRGEATLSKWAKEYFEANPEEKETREISDLIPDLPEHLNSPYHVSSQTESYFWGPVSLYIDTYDKLYVVETNRHRVQIFQGAK